MKLYSIQDYDDSSEIQRFCERLSNDYCKFLIKQYNLQKNLDASVLETLKTKLPHFLDSLDKDQLTKFFRTHYAPYILREYFMQQSLENRKNLITEIMISFL